MQSTPSEITEPIASTEGVVAGQVIIANGKYTTEVIIIAQVLIAIPGMCGILRLIIFIA
ncbi:unannotated protein [freshwater metagenome]|uniref:Unannotated protein n=1 Tax=freshwater metagenome TaxID=449393 RepID=A0A6J6J510_9ZZZZ